MLLISHVNRYIKNKEHDAMASVASWLSVVPCIEKLLVQFLVMAQT